jgi:hypothetical protein
MATRLYYTEVLPLEAGVSPAIETIMRITETIGATVLHGLFFAEENPLTQAKRQRELAQAAEDRRRAAENETRQIVEERRKQRGES